MKSCMVYAIAVVFSIILIEILDHPFHQYEIFQKSHCGNTVPDGWEIQSDGKSFVACRKYEFLGNQYLYKGAYGNYMITYPSISKPLKFKSMEAAICAIIKFQKPLVDDSWTKQFKPVRGK